MSHRGFAHSAWIAAFVLSTEAASGDSWLSAAQERIRAAEYEITWQEPAWQAPNRAHDFRTHFTPSGIRVVPRTERQPRWELGLSLAIDGDATLSTRGNRIDYDRGSVHEWYVNHAQGLEHGFTLTHPSASLVLTLDGSLSLAISADGQALDLTTASGSRVLRYAELRVTDAAGRTLPARFEIGGRFPNPGLGDNFLRVAFDAAGATYPVTVNSLLTGAAWWVEGNQPGASLGSSVATAGDVNGDGYSDVVIGAPLYDNGAADEGRAFVYRGSASGLNVSPDWIADGGQAGALFGISVSTAGDVDGDGYSDVVVGASGAGRAYVYRGSAGGLGTAPASIAESDQSGSGFGISVSTAGDVDGDGRSDVIVGADAYDHGETDEGRAFLYPGSASGLGPAPSWSAESNRTGAHFGGSVRTAGDVNGDGFADVIVGADRYEQCVVPPCVLDGGRAFVYQGSAAGLGAAPAWNAKAGQASARFGGSVSTAGDVNGDGYADVIVGASRYDNGQNDEGRAFVYHGSALGLNFALAWKAEGEQIEALFAGSVSTAGDVNGDGYADVVIGAAGHDDEGRAVVYHGSSTGLSSAATWTTEIHQPGALVGSAVSVAGDVNGDGYSDLIVGAPGYDEDEPEEGLASVYHGSADGVSTIEAWSTTGDHDFAISLSTAGDVNGDGYADVIVGTPGFVYHGSATGLATTPDWIHSASTAHSVATAGDVNGDGYADVIVGSPGYNFDLGRVFVYHGSAAGLGAQADWIVDGNPDDPMLGLRVATAGDVNGDGYSDVMVVSANNLLAANGRVFVYYGSATGLSATASWIAESDQTSSFFGSAVSTAGDVDGDGYSDIIIGDVGYDNGQNNEGRVSLYHGGWDGLGADAIWEGEGNAPFANFGRSVSTAGDVNGDGYSDVLVGTNDDRAFLYLGSPAGLNVPDWIVDVPGTKFGASVSTAGDVNGDGYSDVLIGAYSYDNSQSNEGQALVYHGSPAGLPETAAWAVESDEAIAQLGRVVATAGDVNGDGYADVLVADTDYSASAGGVGRIRFYHGGGGRCLDLVPQQVQPADDVPIAPLGRSTATDQYRLRLLARSPFGRGRTKLEWEVKPLGALFDGEGTVTSPSWTDLTGNAAQLSEIVTGLTAETLYHWRVRLRYDPVSTPYQQRSRWITMPSNGWNESDLRTLDADGDGVTAALDCDNADPTVWGTPGEALALVVLADKQTFSWQQPLSPGGTLLRYDLLRTPTPDDFVVGTDCAASDVVTTTAGDGTIPGPGQLLAYLVRAENDCPQGEGSLGKTSAGAERAGRVCP